MPAIPDDSDVPTGIRATHTGVRSAPDASAAEKTVPAAARSRILDDKAVVGMVTSDGLVDPWGPGSRKANGVPGLLGLARAFGGGAAAGHAVAAVPEDLVPVAGNHEAE